MNILPFTAAHQLGSVQEQNAWLIEQLWAEQAVGIVGGEPKSCKSFLALDVAVSVASGARCLGRFEPTTTGPVLLFAAEDALTTVRQRLESISHVRQVPFKKLDLQVITAPSLRLDTRTDQQRLAATVEHLKPKLLLLDPFVRLHRIDENVSADVAPLLDFLRQLQRRFHTAVLVVHHARKGGHKMRAGQALRGSSEFHAWGDSNLYLRRRQDQLTLSIEQRAAPSIADIPLELMTSPKAVALEIVDVETPPTVDQPGSSPSDKIQSLLKASQPLSFLQLRKACQIRTQRLCNALAELQQDGRVLKTPMGYRLSS